MSIYATLWKLKFPNEGDEHHGCDWLEITAVLLPLLPAIAKRAVVPLKKEGYGQGVKAKKPATTRSPAPVAQAKPSRAEIRREEPRRSAPRATSRTTERGNQPRSHKSGKK